MDFKIEDATVFVKSVQEMGDETQDGIEFFAAGSYYCKNGTKYIRYVHTDEDVKEETSTVLKVEGNERVTVIQNGPQQYRLVLQKGERQHAVYRTPFGELLLGVSGTKIKSDLDDKGGTLKLEYMLDINNAVASRNILEIKVKGTVS